MQKKEKIKLPSGSNGLLAVDLGSRTIKLLELTLFGNKIVVKNFIQQQIEPYKEKSPDERKEIYIKTLKEMLITNKIRTKKAVVAISGISVAVKFAGFPKMSAAKFKKEINSKAAPHIPFNIDDVILDAQIQGNIKENDRLNMETMLVAGAKDAVYEATEIVENAGLFPWIVDVDSFALGNIFQITNNKKDFKGMVMLLDIGATIATINVIENGVSKLVRHLNMAGDDFTKAVADNMTIFEDDAEELKIKYGLLCEKATKNNKSGKDSQEKDNNLGNQVYSSIYPVISKLNSSIQRSMDYLISQYEDRGIRIKKILLSGGSANLKGLPEFMSADLKIPVEVFRPLKKAKSNKIKNDFDGTSPALAVPAGLAVRKIENNKALKTKINLLPKEMVINSFDVKKILTGIGVLGIISLLPIYFLWASNITKIEHELYKATRVVKKEFKTKAKPVKKIIKKEAKKIYPKYLYLKRLQVNGVFADEKTSYAILSGKDKKYIIKQGRLMDEDEKIIWGVRAYIKKEEIILVTKNKERYVLEIPK